MSQIKFKFIETINNLNLQNARTQNGDSLLTAIGKLQGQIDANIEVYIQQDLPSSHGPYVWYQTFSDSQTVYEWIHDGVSDLLNTGGFVLNAGNGFVLRIN